MNDEFCFAYFQLKSPQKEFNAELQKSRDAKGKKD
jgi:hypothetical protein